MNTLELFNEIVTKNQMPQEWQTGMLINRNGDKQEW
jgi:hypothetical protein